MGVGVGGGWYGCDLRCVRVHVGRCVVVVVCVREREKRRVIRMKNTQAEKKSG